MKNIYPFDLIEYLFIIYNCYTFMKDQISKQNNESEIEDLIKQKVTMMVDTSELANKKKE